MSGIRSRQPKSSKIISHNIRYHGQILAGGRRQLHHAIHTIHHIYGVPSCHCHIAHGVGGFLCGKLGCSAQFLSHAAQLFHFGGRSPGQSLHI